MYIANNANTYQHTTPPPGYNQQNAISASDKPCSRICRHLIIILCFLIIGITLAIVLPLTIGKVCLGASVSTERKCVDCGLTTNVFALNTNCHGVLINRRTILTTQQCGVYNSGYSVTAIKSHSNISLVILVNPLSLSNDFGLACLPKDKMTNEDVRIGYNSGNIVALSNCGKAANEPYICADSCQKEGTPLFMKQKFIVAKRYVVAGLASGCYNGYGIFIRVSDHVDWIKDNWVTYVQELSVTSGGVGPF